MARLAKRSNVNFLIDSGVLIYTVYFHCSRHVWEEELHDRDGYPSSRAFLLHGADDHLVEVIFYDGVVDLDDLAEGLWQAARDGRRSGIIIVVHGVLFCPVLSDVKNERKNPDVIRQPPCRARRWRP